MKIEITELPAGWLGEVKLPSFTVSVIENSPHNAFNKVMDLYWKTVGLDDFVEQDTDVQQEIVSDRQKQSPGVTP